MWFGKMCLCTTKADYNVVYQRPKKVAFTEAREFLFA